MNNNKITHHYNLIFRINILVLIKVFIPIDFMQPYLFYSYEEYKIKRRLNLKNSTNLILVTFELVYVVI